MSQLNTEQMPIGERLMERVVIGHGGECWEWVGKRDREGYGLVKWFGKLRRAHRVQWIYRNGAPPFWMHVLHKCDNPPCIRPEHLYLGTDKDNAQDRVTRGRQGKRRVEKA